MAPVRVLLQITAHGPRAELGLPDIEGAGAAEVQRVLGDAGRRQGGGVVRERRFALYLAFVTLLVCAAFAIDVPWLHQLLEQATLVAN